MNERLHWIFPSIFLGRIASTDIRVSWWFALVPLIVCPKYHLELGLAYSVLLVLSVLIHEFSHLSACRWTGGMADEIQLMPLGGLSLLRPGQGAYGAAMTALAGPLANLTICLIAFPGWYAPKQSWSVLYPFALPINQFSETELMRDLGLLLFNVNWMLFLINLLPVMPLDGGQVLRAVLSVRIHPELVQRTTLHVGLLVSFILLIGGGSLDFSPVVLIGTFVLMVNLVQLIEEDVGEALDESGYGFELPSSFDSLEGINPTAIHQTRPGLLQRWREMRRMKREQLERVRRIEAEQQLDTLLAKVHEGGLQSLSDLEKKQLKNCSELLKPRTRSAD